MGWQAEIFSYALILAYSTILIMSILHLGIKHIIAQCKCRCGYTGVPNFAVTRLNYVRSYSAAFQYRKLIHYC